MTDIGAGLVCVAGVVAALYERRATGVGSHVSTSLLEFALASLSTLAAPALVTGETPGLLGTHSPTFAPYGAFRTADGWIALAGAGSDELWERLCIALDSRDLIEDQRFLDNATRVANRDALTHEIEATLAESPASQWLGILDAAGIRLPWDALEL